MKIEEITEQLEQYMKVKEHEQQNPSQDGSEATKPNLPPAMEAYAGMTTDEIIADLNKSPLFMTELEDNDDIAALQALNYEGSALENAAGFKDRGNECFRGRGFGDAKEFYTKGIQIIALEERKRANGEVTTSPEGEVDTPEEIENQKAMLEALYVNRSACHLEMKNYRSCWLDGAGALKLNPKNVKACYRSAKALLAVDRIEEADDICARGLAVDPENKGLKVVAEEIIKRAKEVDAKKKKESERLAKEKRRELLLKAALHARNIPTRETERPPDMEDAKIELVPDPDDPQSSLAFPTVLFYPEDMETDFIKAFNEQQTLEDHLSYVFPLPWDQSGSYTLAGVECFVETMEGGLLKMGKKLPLLKVLATGKVEVVDQVMKIFVVPKEKAAAWAVKYKEQRAAQMGKK